MREIQASVSFSLNCLQNQDGDSSDVGQIKCDDVYVTCLVQRWTLKEIFLSSLSLPPLISPSFYLVLCSTMIMIIIEGHLYKTVEFRRMVTSKVGFDRMNSFYKMPFIHEIDVTLGIVRFAIMW